MKVCEIANTIFIPLFVFFVLSCYQVCGAQSDDSSNELSNSKATFKAKMSRVQLSALEKAVDTGYYQFEVLELSGLEKSRLVVLFGEENHHLASVEQLSAAKNVVNSFRYRAAEFAQDDMSGLDARYLMNIFRGLVRTADYIIGHNKLYFEDWHETSMISYALTRGTTLTSLNEILYNGLHIGDLRGEMEVSLFSQRMDFLENQIGVVGLSDKVYENIGYILPLRILSTGKSIEDFGRLSPTNSTRLFFNRALPEITVGLEYGNIYKWMDWPHKPFRNFSMPGGISLRDYRMAENIVLLSFNKYPLSEPILVVSANTHIRFIKSLLVNKEFVEAVLEAAKENL